MKICIVGASSYIGGWLVEYFNGQGHELTVVYRKEPICDSNWKASIKNILIGDITEEKLINKIVDSEPEILIYLISLNHIQSEIDIVKTLNTNVSPLISLASKLAVRPDFKKFIYFSTLQAVGKINSGQILNEEVEPAPLNMYGLTHLYCEQALDMLWRAKNLQYCSLRLANSYGQPKFSSCDSLWLVINDFCLNAIQKGVIQLKSDGTPQRDFIFLKDVARAVDFIIQKNELVPKIVNISSEKTMTMLELAHLTKSVCKSMGIKVDVKLPEGIDSFSADHHLLVKRYKIESWLYKAGFKSDVSLEDGIKDTLTFFLKN